MLTNFVDAITKLTTEPDHHDYHSKSYQDIVRPTETTDWSTKWEGKWERKRSRGAGEERGMIDSDCCDSFRLLWYRTTMGYHGGKRTGSSCGNVGASSKHALAAASDSLTWKWLQLTQAGETRPQNETKGASGNLAAHSCYATEHSATASCFKPMVA